MYKTIFQMDKVFGNPNFNKPAEWRLLELAFGLLHPFGLHSPSRLQLHLGIIFLVPEFEPSFRFGEENDLPNKLCALFKFTPWLLIWISNWMSSFFDEYFEFTTFKLWNSRRTTIKETKITNIFLKTISLRTVKLHWIVRMKFCN